jgi:hypothetical protein
LKGQTSVEFISLISLSLLVSSVFVTALSERKANFSEYQPTVESEKIAQKVSFVFEYLKSQNNSSTKLKFSPKLSRNYNITTGEGITTVKFRSGESTFPTNYEGPKKSLNTSRNYEVKYNGTFYIKK